MKLFFLYLSRLTSYGLIDTFIVNNEYYEFSLSPYTHIPLSPYLYTLYNIIVLKLHSKNKGFTLVEVLIGVIVITILSLAVVVFLKSIFKNSTMFQSSLSSENNIRKTFKNFTTEVRGASNAWDGTYVIETASNNTFSFYSNIDSDKYTEKIKYYLSGNKIYREVIKYNTVTSKYDTGTSTKIIIDNIIYSTSTPVFKYYDSNYDGSTSSLSLSEPVDISKIRLVSFRIYNNKYVNKLNSIDFNEVKASIRNLKDNY